MKEYSPNPSIDWTNPASNRDQHRIRYMDQSLHAIFADVNAPVTYQSTKPRNDGLTPDAVTMLIPKQELVKIRNHVLFNRRQNFIDTGGDKTMIDTNIQFGAHAEVTDTQTGLVVIHKKL